MTTKELRRIIESRRTVMHWGSEHNITPRLVSEVFGDGNKLIQLAPTMYRPNYFVVRIDSKHSTNWHDENGPDVWLEDVYESIEYEFHEWPWADDYWPGEDCCDGGDGEDHRRVSFDDGSCWGEMEWPKQKRTKRTEDAPK